MREFLVFSELPRPGKPIIFAAAFRPKYYRLMFLAAALWNALAAVAVLFLINKGNLRTALEAISHELLAACLATFGLGYYWVPRSIEESRPGAITCDGEAARVRRVFWTPDSGEHYAALGASIPGGLTFWDTLSGISRPFQKPQ